MKTFFYPLAAALALFSLTGCGLKGPLYFPPTNNKTVTKPADTQTQNPSPDRNDRGETDTPTQVVY